MKPLLERVLAQRVGLVADLPSVPQAVVVAATVPLRLLSSHRRYRRACWSCHALQDPGDI